MIYVEDFRFDKQTGVGSWGDLGNGYYRNPVLLADYSDPDIIRVGSDFYMVSSEFHFMGMPVLHSKDLVNWKIIGQVYNRLDIHSQYNTMEKYGAGSWAPSIRYHDGLFYVYFCTPDEGLYMSTAKNPTGPWAPLHEVKRAYRWEDPCPFWDDDGQAYLGRSQWGAGPIYIHKMSCDGKKLLDDGVIVYEGPVAEGTKIYKRNEYYYIIIPEGGVPLGWETALRAKNIYGPYEKKVVLAQGDTWVNGPHQGGLVELENGESWFMHFSSMGAMGRVCHLQPVTWVEDWPIMGYSKDKKTAGEPVIVWKKPTVEEPQQDIYSPQSSDDFTNDILGPQWQWNHNPEDNMWSLTERPGYLRLRPQPSMDFLRTRNMLTQKIMGLYGVITVELSTKNMGPFQRAGVAILGGQNSEQLFVENRYSERFIGANVGGSICGKVAFDQDSIWLRITINGGQQIQFYYSLNGVNYKYFSASGKISSGYWKGARIALFTNNAVEGCADFKSFRYEHDGPGGRR